MGFYERPEDRELASPPALHRPCDGGKLQRRRACLLYEAHRAKWSLAKALANALS